MAHELDLSNGRANMAYIGEVPWHGLGKPMAPNASPDQWRIEAGMNWTAEEAVVRYDASGFDTALVMADRKVIYRSDTKAPLAVVGADYHVVQPSTIIDFFGDLTRDHGMSMETAGCLFGGRKFWALARCGKSFRIMGQDEVAPFLLLATSVDGSMATCGHFTGVRVVCNNTLRASIGAGGAKASVKVYHSSKFDASQVKIDLGIIHDQWGAYEATANKLAAMKIDRDTAIDFVANFLKDEWIGKDGEALDAKGKLNASNQLRSIIRLYDGEGMGAHFKSARGTAWGLVNAVTEHFDHLGTERADPSRAFERAHLTDRATDKVKFTNELLKLAA